MAKSKAAARAGWLLALLLQGTVLAAMAVDAPRTISEPASQAVPSSNISYVDGQLRIDAHNATLAEVLTKVAALTGVKIDVPAGADSERMWLVQLGPGPAREVLANLLSDSNCDYVIQDSDTDSGKIQRVLLLPREKHRSNGTNVAARPPRSPYARAVEPTPEETPVPDPVPAEASNVPEPSPSSPDLASAQSLQSLRPVQQPSNVGTSPGAMTPPQTLDQQSINQQLQQMYQQRMQMIQQERQVASPAGAAPGATIRP